VKLWTPPAAAGLLPPSGHLYASAVWLVRRHPRLLELADRAGVVRPPDEDGDVLLDLDELAAALNALDAYWLAWKEYGEPPYREEDYDAWVARGPKHTHPLSAAIAPMSRTEVTRLRLLAFFSSDRIALRAGDLYGLDNEGQSLLRDWSAAVLAA
jgi:hypothetical protein